MKLKELKEELRKAQIAQLEKNKEEYKELKTFKEILDFLPKFDDIDIYLPWLKSPFQDIYGEELKKKEWKEYILSGVCGADMAEYYKKRGYKEFYVVSDDILNDCLIRGVDLNLIDKLRELIGDWGTEECLVSVLISRTTSNLRGGKDYVGGLLYEIRIPAIQAANDIIKWCFDNNCIGYNQDW